MKKIRNAVARLPIMKKGGVHDKTNKAKRKKQKQKLQKQIRTNSFGPYFLYLFILAVIESHHPDESPNHLDRYCE